MNTLIDHAKSERQRIILDAAPRTPAEQTALDAALFERERADRYEVAIRRALLDLGRNKHGFAARELHNALIA